MYLDNLNYEEKHSFIELAKIVSEIDGEVSFEETNVINQYIKEIRFSENFEFSYRDFDGILKSFENSSLTNKKIILFEILILVKADNKFCEKEKEIINLLVKSFNINREDCKDLMDITSAISLSLRKASEIIFE